MADLFLTQFFSFVVGGITKKGGSLGTPKTVTIADSEEYDKTFKFTAGGAPKIIYLASATPPDLEDWAFMFIESDVAGQIRLVADVAGATSRQGFVLSLLAGIPQMIPGGDNTIVDAVTIDSVSDDWSADTAAAIDKIEFFSAVAAVVRITLYR